MYTRCPECETTFKLSVTDLRRAQGKVRCGDCNFVFNAIEFLAEEPEEMARDELPVLENPADLPQADPVANADSYNHLDVANDSSLEEPPDINPEAGDTPETTSVESAAESDDKEGWSPVEPSNDWLESAGVIIDSGRKEPTLSSFGQEELPTEVHVQPTHESSNLPTVTMETLAPDFAQESADETADPEAEQRGEAGFREQDEDTDSPVLDLPSATEFQEEPFVDTGTEESWSNMSGETLEYAEDDDPVDMPYGTITDETISAEAFLAEENDNEEVETADGFSAEDTTQEADDPEADEAPEESSDFDDSIWEKIPGVGASDEDWESLKSGSHRALSDEDKLADGLSYTNTELKMVSANEPVEDYLGGLQAQDEPEANEDAAAETEYPEPDLTFPDVTDEAQEGDELPGAPAELQGVFDGGDEAASETPENSEAVEAALPEVFSQAETPAEESSEEPFEETNSVQEMLADTAEDDEEFADKWVSFFGAEPKPEELTGEQEQLDEEEPAAEVSGAEAHAADDPDEESFTDEDSFADTEPGSIAAEPFVPEFSTTVPDIDQEELDVTEAELKPDGTFDDEEHNEVGEFDELHDDHEPEQPEPAESLIAEISQAFDDEDKPKQDFAEEAKTSPEEAGTEDDPLSVFKREFDPQTDTWTGLEGVEDVVMSTGIFDSEFIEEIRQKAAADEKTADGDTADAQQSAQDGAEMPATPVWESEYANIDTEQTKQASRGWLWSALLFLLVICFPAQLIHYNRDNIAAHPAWGESVRGVYGSLGLPLYPDWPLDSYEIRGHEAIAGESDEDVLDIRTEIAVVGDTAVGVPHLRVILRDRWANPLAASNFAPVEYTDTDNLPDDGMLQPNQKIPAHVSIVDPGTGAQGYELEICLPRRNEGLICTDQPFK